MPRTELLTMTDVAAMAKCSKSTVHRACTEKDLPAFRDGAGRVWIITKDAEKWIAKRSDQTPAY